MEPLDDASAFELVSILIGSGEAEAERAEVTELVRLCGGVPKVIGIAVGPVRRHDSIRIADVLAGLRTEIDGAEGPVDQDSILGMVADRAYHSLTPEAARLYRALSWHPEGDVSKHAILALAQHPSGTGEPPLIDLLEHHLLEPLQTDRYKLSYLVRAHARRHAISVDGPRAERETLKVLASWYAAWAHSADKTMIPNRTRVFATEPSRRPPFTTGDDKDENKRDARDWFEAERYNLLAIQRRCFDEGWYDLVMRLGESMWVMYIGGRYLEDWLDSSRLAVTAAVDSGHPAAEVRFRAFLARALMENAAIATEPDRLFDEAARELTRARELPMADGIGPDLRASAIEFTGRWYSYKGQYREAIDCYRQAIPLFASQAERTDLPDESRRASQRGVTLQLHFIGRCLLKLGDLTGAAEHLRQAESRMVGTDHDRDVATIRTDLGEALRRLGRLDEAFAVVTAAVDVLAYKKWYRIEISALRQLALVAEARGDTELERTCLERLRDLYTATHDTELSAVEERLRRL